MYRRKRPRTYYYCRGKAVIGFYTDPKGRIRPITRRERRKRDKYLPKFEVLLSKQRIQAEKPSLKTIVSYVLSQAPIVKELYTSYILADTLYKNWGLIGQVLKKEELESVIGRDIVHSTLSSVQTDIIWALINPFIPKEYHDVGRHILANVIDHVTNEEIKLVRQFLQRSEKFDSKLGLQEHHKVKNGTLINEK